MKLFNSDFVYHKTLAPRIWNADLSIDQLVSQSLQMMAWEFVRYLQMVGIPLQDADVRDIFVHGGISNYYWDKCSDIDMCILVDLSRVRAALPADIDWFMLYKSLLHSWKRTYRISIHGRGVDISIADVTEMYGAGNTGYHKVGPAYSLVHNSWIRPPQRMSDAQIRALRRGARLRYRVIMRQCRYMLRTKMSDAFIDAYLVNLQNIRTQSMAAQYQTPVTPMTMAFKMVRNSGTLRKLRKLALRQRSKTYRLD